jgi:hypothetical protein
MSGKVLIGLVLVGGAVAGGITLWFQCAHPESRRVSVSIDRPLVDPVLSRVVSSGPMSRPRDYFRCITQPEYHTVTLAADSMSDTEVVIGLEIDGDRRAYPINYLNDHEMVQDTIGGRPLLITW